MKQARLCIFCFLQELQVVLRMKKISVGLAKMLFRPFGMSPVSNWALELKS